MQENSLLRISLLLSLAGLAAMSLIASNMNIDKTAIGSITPGDIGRTLKACGEVENKFTSKNGHTFFSLNDNTGKIKVVIFNSTKTEVKANQACVTGRIDLYQGEIEIITKEVKDV